MDVLWHGTPGQSTIATIKGLYPTDNGEGSWFPLPGPPAQQTVHRLMQAGDGTIWAGAADGLWRSADFGATWQRAPLPAITILRLGRLEGLEGGDEWLWAGSEGDGLWLSPDGGDSWRLAGLPGESIYSLSNHPLRPGWLLAATGSGLFTARWPAAVP